MKKVLLFVFILVVTSSCLFANGLSLNSIGAKALGMGGAFVGLADDGSAIYWNPAGLLGQVNGISLSVADVIPFGNYKYDLAAIDADQIKNNYLSPNLFVNFSLDKMAFGLGIYVPAGLGAEYVGEDLQNFTAIPGVYPGSADIEWMSKIGVISISPSFAYQMTDKWSLGVSGNVYYGMFDLKRFAANTPDGAGGYISHQYEESSTGLGYGATFGTMFKFSDKVNLGLTYRTPVTVNMSGTAENGAFAAAGVPESDFDREVSWPTWIAGGIALTPTNKVTLTFDLQWSQWSTLEKLVTEYEDETWVALTEPSGANEFILNWDSKTQVRMGLEYQAKQNLAVRTGFYYDPAPAPDETVNILFPSSTNSVITGGLCYTKGAITVDLGTEYLFAIERNISAAAHNMPGKHKMSIFATSLGIGYNF